MPVTALIRLPRRSCWVHVTCTLFYFTIFRTQFWLCSRLFQLVAMFDEVLPGRTDSPRENKSGYSTANASPEPPPQYHPHMLYHEPSRGEIEVNEEILKASKSQFISSVKYSAAQQVAVCFFFLNLPTPKQSSINTFTFFCTCVKVSVSETAGGVCVCTGDERVRVTAVSRAHRFLPVMMSCHVKTDVVLTQRSLLSSSMYSGCSP